MIKRSLDLVLSVVGLIILLPVFVALALWIRMDSEGPAIFRQQRVGREGRSFLIHKFRTMVSEANALGPSITVKGDPRITRAGRVLRRYKLDELPQLIDVVVGNMSLVGPRPEVPHYVDLYPPSARKRILSVRPGITDPASLAFMRESELLADFGDADEAYVRHVLPAKLALYEEYLDNWSIRRDLRIVVATILAIFRSRAVQSSS